MSGGEWFRLLLAVAAGCTAAGVILGVLWWLIRPRLEDYLERLVSQSEEATAGCVRGLEAVAKQIEEQDARLRHLEQTRSPENFLEFVDLLEAVLHNRPRPPSWPPGAAPDGHPPSYSIRTDPDDRD